MIFALDPGPERSALVAVEDGHIYEHVIWPNEELVGALWPMASCSHLVIEQIESFGMPVGREVFETVFWAGRFAEAWPGTWSLLPRRAVKLALCGTVRATDATIRQAVIDRYGSTRAAAIGTKRAPGPLYGIKGDAWQALALALAYQESQCQTRSVGANVGDGSSGLSARTDSARR